MSPTNPPAQNALKPNTKTVDDVRRFWDSNPLLTGEIRAQAGTKEWFDQFDAIKTKDIFLDDLTDWVYPQLSGKRILDVGCGPGFWNRQLGRMDLEYYGIDLSPVSVELARTSQRTFGLKGSIQVGNAEKLEFKDGYFDHVLSEGVIHHTPNTEQCVEEIFRVLAPGGTACISFYYRNLILRNPCLFRMTLSLMRALKITLKGRKREDIADAKTPEEFVRIYDGGENPVGKAYSKAELKKMFSRFKQVRFQCYYIPSRALPLRVPKFLLSCISKTVGLMILVKATK